MNIKIELILCIIKIYFKKLKIYFFARCFDCLNKITVNMDGKKEGIDEKVFFFNFYLNKLLFIEEMYIYKLNLNKLKSLHS